MALTKEQWQLFADLVEAHPSSRLPKVISGGIWFNCATSVCFQLMVGLRVKLDWLLRAALCRLNAPPLCRSCIRWLLASMRHNTNAHVWHHLCCVDCGALRSAPGQFQVNNTMTFLPASTATRPRQTRCSANAAPKVRHMLATLLLVVSSSLASAATPPETRVPTSNVVLPEAEMTRANFAAAEAAFNAPIRDAAGRVSYIIDLHDAATDGYSRVAPPKDGFPAYLKPETRHMAASMASQYSFAPVSLTSWIGNTHRVPYNRTGGSA